MNSRWWLKFGLLAAVSVYSALTVAPTLNGGKPLLGFDKKVNLGLDLQGGLYLVMGVDFKKVYREVLDRQGQSLKDRLQSKGISVVGFEVGEASDDPRARLQFNAGDEARIKDLISSDFYSLRLTESSKDKIELGLSNEYRSEIRDRTVNQSIEVIRNRVDEFGVAEPVISSQGSDRVVVELPGIKEVDRAKDLIGRTAKLEFHIVDDESKAPGELEQLIVEAEKTLGVKPGSPDVKFSEYVQKINETLKAKLPAGTEIAFQKAGEGRIPYLLISKTEVTGADLQDAQVGFNQETQLPEVNFEFNPKGAVLFEKLTGENIRKRLAIVLDGIVHSAPSINSKIGARGVISMGRGGYDEVMRESKDLAIVLRAGALPAQLELMEQRVVGPSLGADSVSKGAFAAIVGILAVFLLTAVYYRVSGLIAVFSLVLNVLFVLAIFVGLGATLTLPGIAGIALTVGIAVDSNVVIYERIREELLSGRGVLVAVNSGFQKAFRTILDANVANGIAAVILMMYGSGPVRGFAVTMMIGIVTTLFTAVFVCRLMFDVYTHRLDKSGSQTLSI